MLHYSTVSNYAIELMLQYTENKIADFNYNPTLFTWFNVFTVLCFFLICSNIDLKNVLVMLLYLTFLIYIKKISCIRVLTLIL